MTGLRRAFSRSRFFASRSFAHLFRDAWPVTVVGKTCLSGSGSLVLGSSSSRATSFHTSAPIHLNSILGSSSSRSTSFHATAHLGSTALQHTSCHFSAPGHFASLLGSKATTLHFTSFLGSKSVHPNSVHFSAPVPAHTTPLHYSAPIHPNTFLGSSTRHSISRLQSSPRHFISRLQSTSFQSSPIHPSAPSSASSLLDFGEGVGVPAPALGTFLS